MPVKQIFVIKLLTIFKQKFFSDFTFQRFDILRRTETESELQACSTMHETSGGTLLISICNENAFTSHASSNIQFAEGVNLMPSELERILAWHSHVEASSLARSVESVKASVVMNLANHRMHSHNHSRMDVLQAIGVQPGQLQPHLMNQMETFPKDYHPPKISKKFFAPAYVYKQFYVGDDNKEQPMMVMKKLKKKTEEEKEEEEAEEEEVEEEKEESMMESLDPFACESEEEEDDEEEDDE